MNRIRDYLAKTLAIFFLETPVAKNGFRIAVGMVLAASIAIFIHAENPYWAVFSVILMMQSTMGASFERGLLRLLGTFAGVIIGYFLAGLVVNHIIFYYLTIFLVITVSNYLSLNSKYPYGYIVLGVTAYIILASLLMSTQNTFQFAIWRGVEIAIGVLSGWLVMFFLFPVKASEQADKILQTNRQLLAQLMIEIKKTIYEKDHEDESIKLINQLNTNIAKLSALQNIIPKEVIHDEFKIMYFNTLIDAQMNQINFVKNIYLFIAEKPLGRRILQKELMIESIFELIIQLFDVSEKNEAKLMMQCHDIQQKINASKLQWDLLKDNDITQYEIWENIDFYGLLQDLQLLLDASQKYLDIQYEHVQVQQIEKKEKHNDFKQLFIYNVDYLKASIKVGLSSVIAIYIWSQTNWPIGVMGVISAFIIAIQKNIYDVQLQGELRFLGALVGGSIGLGCLYFFVYDFPVLILSLFVFGWIFGYLSSTESRYTYAALQANMALAITLVNGNSPLLTVEPAVQRVGGVLFGIVIAFLVARFIWPVHPKQLLEKLANKIFNLETKIFDNTLCLNETVEVSQLSQAISEYLNLIATFKVYRHNYDDKLQHALVIRRLLCRLSTLVLSIFHKTEYQKAKILAKNYDIDLDQFHHTISALLKQLSYYGLDEVLAKKIGEARASIMKTLDVIREKHVHKHVAKISIKDSMPLFQLLEAYLRLLNSLLHAIKLDEKVIKRLELIAY